MRLFCEITQTHLLVESSKRRVLTHDDVDLRAETPEDARKLQRDVPSPDDHDLVGAGREVEGFIRRDAVLAAWQGGHKRPAPHRDENVFCRVLLPVHFHCVRVHHLQRLPAEGEVIRASPSRKFPSA